MPIGLNYTELILSSFRLVVEMFQFVTEQIKYSNRTANVLNRVLILVLNRIKNVLVIDIKCIGNFLC